jgi:hypothetical protein
MVRLSEKNMLDLAQMLVASEQCADELRPQLFETCNSVAIQLRLGKTITGLTNTKEI